MSAAVLNDFCEMIVDCEHKTAEPTADGTYPLIRTPDIGLGVLLLDRAQRVDAETYRAWTKRAVPRPGDLILAREAPVGNVGIVQSGVKPVLGQRTVLIRTDQSRLDARFLNYLLSAPALRGWMHGVSIGATVPHLNMADIRAMPMPPLPPLPIQRKVGAILSAYDDLIENNNRRITLLEEMAQRIYREWFVDYRYPGHEHVALVDSECGLIPQGWSTGRIGDHATVIRGRSYRGIDVVDEGGVPFINLKCIARDGGFRPDGVKRYAGEFKDTHKAGAGDIVMAVTDMTQERRIVARAARVPDVGEEFGIFSMDLVKIVPKDVPAEYLLGLLRYSDFPDEVKAHANGANVLHLHPDRISDYHAIFSSPATARDYSCLVAPAQHLSDGLHATNERLREARGVLLPRLVSGEVDVTALDIAIPEAAA